MALVDYSLIITVNRRLSRVMTEQYSAEQIVMGKSVWETPDILPWSSWLNVLWRQTLNQADESKANTSLVLLTKLQTQTVWETILRSSNAANGLLQIGETTRMAMEAWRLLHEYDLTLNQIMPRLEEQNVDTRAFADWAETYQLELQQNNWIDPSLLSLKLISMIKADELILPDKILLAGFDELTPIQQRLINLLLEKNCRVSTHGADSAEPKVSQLTCRDADHELQFAAARARYLLEQDPQAKIGIVVPDLQSRKTKIQAVFEDTLVPDHVLPGSDTSTPFNISLGDPLSSFPVIKTALQILSVAVGRLPLEDLSRLIRSPFIVGSESELSKRSLLDAQLRQFGDSSIGMVLVSKEAGDAEKNWHSPKLVEAFTKFQSVIDETDLAKKQTIVEWVALFDELLEQMGWPGERTISSDEHQAIESWRTVREQCVSLDAVTQPMNYASALQHLRKTATDQTFQAEGSNVPIQVLGMLEAAGIEFDQLLVLGMTDELWPAKPSPNPFLPLQLQRKKKISHASAEVELRSANIMTARLLKAAPDIIFTYPNQAGDQLLRSSPLIKGFEHIQQADVAISEVENLREKICKESVLEKLEDNQAQPLPENVTWSGGVGIFKDQAACPFRAFVRHRLHAQPLGIAESGLNPAERGSLVHDSLENLWGRIKTHDRLIKMSAEKVSSEVRCAVKAAIDNFRTGKSVIKEEQFQTLEAERLEKLLIEWLDVEQKREAFEVIAREKEMQLSVGGISVKTRVDRIDRLETGALALIDYKTGDVNTKSWEGERPDEPQLPVYAVGMEETPQAILFAKVKKGEQKFDGFSNDLDIGKKQEGWDEVIEGWRVNLENLADEFVQGDAIVDPKDKKSCQYCTYQSLCRIDEVIEFSGGAVKAAKGE